MTHHTDTERPWWRDRADEIELQVAQGKMGAAACYTQMLQLLDADRRAPAAPVPQHKPTPDQVAEAVGYHASAWDCVDPSDLIDAILMLAAAPQPPEAAPVQMPEPVAWCTEVRTDNSLGFKRKEYGLEVVPGAEIAFDEKLYTEQQVRELLAAQASVSNGTLPSQPTFQTEDGEKAREPLTDDQIESLLVNWPNDGVAFFDFARAIERAHGIGVDKP